MSDQNDVTTEASIGPSELQLLQDRATLIGVPYHPSLGIDKLRTRIDEHLNPSTVTEAPGVINHENITKGKTAPAQVKSKSMTPHQEKMFVLDQQRKAANKLIRVRVTSMNVHKREHQGEIFTVSNAVIGTIKKFVPFNAEDGWHVPQMILTMMQERKCQVFYTKLDTKGRKIKKGKLINEFAIEILLPLDQKEISDLAKQQALANRID